MVCPSIEFNLSLERVADHRPGMERTEKQWTQLLGDAGFRIVKIYVDPSGESEGIIEADLV